MNSKNDRESITGRSKGTQMIPFSKFQDQISCRSDQLIWKRSKSKQHSTRSVTTYKSEKAERDIEGHIDNAIFFKHSENKNLRDDYDIGKVIGTGAYGKVRLVTHRKSGI